MRAALGLWAAAALGGIGTGTQTPVILIPGFPTIEVDFLVPSDCQLPSTLCATISRLHVTPLNLRAA